MQVPPLCCGRGTAQAHQENDCNTVRPDECCGRQARQNCGPVQASSYMIMTSTCLFSGLCKLGCVLARCTHLHMRYVSPIGVHTLVMPISVVCNMQRSIMENAACAQCVVSQLVSQQRSLQDIVSLTDKALTRLHATARCALSLLSLLQSSSVVACSM